MLNKQINAFKQVIDGNIKERSAHFIGEATAAVYNNILAEVQRRIPEDPIISKLGPVNEKTRWGDLASEMSMVYAAGENTFFE